MSHQTVNRPAVSNLTNDCEGFVPPGGGFKTVDWDESKGEKRLGMIRAITTHWPAMTAAKSHLPQKRLGCAPGGGAVMAKPLLLDPKARQAPPSPAPEPIDNSGPRPIPASVVPGRQARLP